jgi:phosphoglycolate phosphatase
MYGSNSKPLPARPKCTVPELRAAKGREKIAMVTAYDVTMARAAGCRAIGVAWGYHTPEELLAAGAEAVATSAAELEDLIDG